MVVLQPVLQFALLRCGRRREHPVDVDVMLRRMIHHHEGGRRTMREDAAAKPATKILTVHLAVLIAGAPFGLEHQRRALDPAGGRHRVHDD